MKLRNELINESTSKQCKWSALTAAVGKRLWPLVSVKEDTVGSAQWMERG